MLANTRNIKSSCSLIFKPMTALVESYLHMFQDRLYKAVSVRCYKVRNREMLMKNCNCIYSVNNMPMPCVCLPTYNYFILTNI